MYAVLIEKGWKREIKQLERELDLGVFFYKIKFSRIFKSARSPPPLYLHAAASTGDFLLKRSEYKFGPQGLPGATQKSSQGLSNVNTGAATCPVHRLASLHHRGYHVVSRDGTVSFHHRGFTVVIRRAPSCSHHRRYPEDIAGGFSMDITGGPVVIGGAAPCPVHGLPLSSPGLTLAQ
jgi:hypothetical protein